MGFLVGFLVGLLLGLRRVVCAAIFVSHTAGPIFSASFLVDLDAWPARLFLCVMAYVSSRPHVLVGWWCGSGCLQIRWLVVRG